MQSPCSCGHFEMRAVIFREDSIGMALSKSCLAREGGCPFSGGSGGEGDEEGEAEESNSESELLLEQTLKKQQYRKWKRRQSGDGGKGDGEVETVTAEIPVDILRRISPLCEKMGLIIKCYVCYVITLMLCFIYFQRFFCKNIGWGT